MKAKLFAIFMTIVTVSKMVSTTSWLNNEEERQFQLNSVASGKNVDWTKIGVRCMDELSNCKNLQNLCELKIVREKCKDTCGGCRLQSPIDCKLTDYGCCWDNVTVATGRNNAGCPVCVDQYSECVFFKENCKRGDIRIVCPITCGVNCNKCHDDPHQATICPMYKSHGFCKDSHEIMSQVCSKTCGFC